MNVELVTNLILLFAAMICATVIVRSFTHYMNRKPGEDWKSVFHRAIEEEKKSRAAQSTMFGSPEATIRAHIIVLTLLAMMACLAAVFPDLIPTILEYVIMGFFFSRKRAGKAKINEYKRLSMRNRLWFRLYFALTWPIGIFSKRC